MRAALQCALEEAGRDSPLQKGEKIGFVKYGREACLTVWPRRRLVANGFSMGYLFISFPFPAEHVTPQ